GITSREDSGERAVILPQRAWERRPPAPAPSSQSARGTSPKGSFSLKEKPVCKTGFRSFDRQPRPAAGIDHGTRRGLRLQKSRRYSCKILTGPLTTTWHERRKPLLTSSPSMATSSGVGGEMLLIPARMRTRQLSQLPLRQL